MGVADRGDAEGVVEVHRRRSPAPVAGGGFRTRLEDLGDRTRVHFTETYHAFNPVLRTLLEKRVHAFISKDNDRLIKDSLTTGVRYLRAAKAKAAAKAAEQAAGPPAADQP